MSERVLSTSDARYMSFWNPTTISSAISLSPCDRVAVVRSHVIASRPPSVQVRHRRAVGHGNRKHSEICRATGVLAAGRASQLAPAPMDPHRVVTDRWIRKVVRSESRRSQPRSGRHRSCVRHCAMSEERRSLGPPGLMALVLLGVYLAYLVLRPF